MSGFGVGGGFVGVSGFGEVGGFGGGVGELRHRGQKMADCWHCWIVAFLEASGKNSCHLLFMAP